MLSKSKIFLLLIIAMVSNSIGDVLLSKTMSGIGAIAVSNVAEGLEIARTILSTPSFWASIGCFCVFFGLWMYLMKQVELSYLLPLSAITYVISALLAGPVLGETVSPLRWLGTILIVIGVGLVADTSPVSGEGNGEESKQCNC